MDYMDLIQTHAKSIGAGRAVFTRRGLDELRRHLGNAPATRLQSADADALMSEMPAGAVGRLCGLWLVVAE